MDIIWSHPTTRIDLHSPYITSYEIFLDTYTIEDKTTSTVLVLFLKRKEFIFGPPPPPLPESIFLLVVFFFKQIDFKKALNNK